MSLNGLIASSNVDAWLFGHSHRNTKECMIGQTKLQTNQLGYVNSREHYAFKTSCNISI